MIARPKRPDINFIIERKMSHVVILTHEMENLSSWILCISRYLSLVRLFDKLLFEHIVQLTLYTSVYCRYDYHLTHKLPR